MLLITWATSLYPSRSILSYALGLLFNRSGRINFLGPTFIPDTLLWSSQDISFGSKVYSSLHINTQSYRWKTPWNITMFRAVCCFPSCSLPLSLLFPSTYLMECERGWWGSFISATHLIWVVAEDISTESPKHAIPQDADFCMCIMILQHFLAPGFRCTPEWKRLKYSSLHWPRC